MMFFLTLFTIFSFGRTLEAFIMTLFDRPGEGYEVIETEDHGFAVVGYVSREWLVYDVFLSKFDEEGNHVFSTIYGGEESDYGISIREIEDGSFFVIGYTRSCTNHSDIFLSKFDSDGSHIWTNVHSCDGYDFTKLSFQETSEGNFIVAGSMRNSSYYDFAFLSLFDSSGNIIWLTFSKGHGAYMSSGTSSVQETSDGCFIMTGNFINIGSFISKFDTDGNLLWTSTLSFVSGTGWDGKSFLSYPTSIHEVFTEEESGLIISGYVETSVGWYDAFISKLSANGSHIWSTTWGVFKEVDNYPIDVIPVVVGGVEFFMVTGWTSTILSPDGFVSKFSTQGIMNWTMSYNGVLGSTMRSIIQQKPTGYILTGYMDIVGLSNVLISKVMDVGRSGEDSSNCDTWMTVLPDRITYTSVVLTEQRQDLELFFTFVSEESITRVTGSFPALIEYISSPEVYKICVSCFGIASTSVYSCSGNGECVDVNDCMCEMNHYGDECDVTTCNGIYSNKTSSWNENNGDEATSLCSGHGECTSFDSCECEDGYSDHDTSFCKDWYCEGIHYSAEQVCSSHGVCTAPNECICDPGYITSTSTVKLPCETWKCFDIFRESGRVCNGHGICTGPDLCVCTGNYQGYDCNYDKNLAIGHYHFTA